MRESSRWSRQENGCRRRWESATLAHVAEALVAENGGFGAWQAQVFGGALKNQRFISWVENETDDVGEYPETSACGILSAIDIFAPGL